jgi:hypothetical protein
LSYTCMVGVAGQSSSDGLADWDRKNMMVEVGLSDSSA